MTCDVLKARLFLPCVFGAGLVVIFLLYGVRQSGNILPAPGGDGGLRTHAAASEARDVDGTPRSVWALGDAVPWPMLTEEKRRKMKMVAQSDRFSDDDHKLMGHICIRPVFLQRSRPIIMLASVPGSGNFWTRYLIEQLTGVYTGSIYSEKITKTRMAGGLWHNASVMAIKTHSLILGNDLDFDGTILLLRNPFAAAKAEFSREATGKHTEAAAVKSFQASQDRFTKNVEVSGSRFEKLVAFWLGVSTARPLHIMYFEDLKTNLKHELEKLAAFLNVDVPAERLQCAVDHRDGVNKRQHSSDYREYNPFTPRLTSLMNSYLRASARILPRVSRYIRDGKPTETAPSRSEKRSVDNLLFDG